MRLPYGLKSASEVFQKKIIECFDGIDGIAIYIDDILIWGSNKAEHDERLKKVLDRARQNNIKFNKNKCRINVDKIKYLGHIITRDGIEPDHSKVDVIKNYPVPTSVKEVQRFLGILNYLHKFIPNLSDLTDSTSERTPEKKYLFSIGI